MLYSKSTKKICDKVKQTAVSILKHEQEKISVECKSNPKKYWNYINKKTHNKVNIGDLKWEDDSGKVVIAESNKDKALALENFYRASAY